MKEGYIKLYRQLQESWVWDGSEPFDMRSAWVDLLLLANHDDNKTVFDGEVITIKRGQRITSVRKLAERWHWGKDKTLKFLKMLEADKMILRNADSRKTLITIVNYAKFQSSEVGEQTVNRHSADSEQTVSRHSPATNKNEKNEKNEKNILSNTIVLDCVEESTQTVENDVQQALDLWNGLPSSVPKVTRLIKGKQRHKWLKARLKEYGIGDYAKAIDNIAASDYLQGKNKYGWTVTFDWFLRPNNFPKVLDGHYNNGKQNGAMSLDEYMMSVINGEGS